MKILLEVIIISLVLSFGFSTKKGIKEKKLPEGEFDMRSGGCSNPLSDATIFGEVLDKTIEINDPRLGIVNRSYQIILPENYDHKKQTPLLIRFHGQGGAYPYEYVNKVGSKQGYIVVQPLGMNDHPSESIDWNVGLFDKGSDFASKTCLKNTPDSACYDSCKKLPDMCNGCSWSTCYDDGFFIEYLMQKIQSEFCINLKRVYAIGQCTGAMMIYYLVQRFPEMFTGVVPVYGSILVGFTNIPENAVNIDQLHFHYRDYTEIPMEGLSNWGWIYESVEVIHERWGREQWCKIEGGNMFKFENNFDGGKRKFHCKRRRGCTGKIYRCLYDGYHGESPKEITDYSFMFFDEAYEGRLDRFLNPKKKRK